MQKIYYTHTVLRYNNFRIEVKKFSSQSYSCLLHLPLALIVPVYSDAAYYKLLKLSTLRVFSACNWGRPEVLGFQGPGNSCWTGKDGNQRRNSPVFSLLERDNSEVGSTLLLRALSWILDIAVGACLIGYHLLGFILSLSLFSMFLTSASWDHITNELLGHKSLSQGLFLGNLASGKSIQACYWDNFLTTTGMVV